MILTEQQRFDRSEKRVWETGSMALIQALGYADALRFLTQFVPGQGDYLAWQEELFGEAGVDAIFEQAEKYWQEKHRPQAG